MTDRKNMKRLLAAAAFPAAAQRITDSGYRTIGHTTDVPMEWAAL